FANVRLVAGARGRFRDAAAHETATENGDPADRRHGSSPGTSYASCVGRPPRGRLRRAGISAGGEGGSTAVAAEHLHLEAPAPRGGRRLEALAPLRAIEEPVQLQPGGGEALAESGRGDLQAGPGAGEGSAEERHEDEPARRGRRLEATGRGNAERGGRREEAGRRPDTDARPYRAPALVVQVGGDLHVCPAALDGARAQH